MLDDIELLADELCGWRDGDDDDVSPSSLRSVDVDDLRTTPTRSLAIRDQDSSRLCVSQQAAGPRPPFMTARNNVFHFSVARSAGGPAVLCLLCGFRLLSTAWYYMQECLFVCLFILVSRQNLHGVGGTHEPREHKPDAQAQLHRLHANNKQTKKKKHYPFPSFPSARPNSSVQCRVVAASLCNSI